MNLSEIQRQVESAIDEAYRAGFEAALSALSDWRDGLTSTDEDPDGMDPLYLDGVDDAIITMEHAR